MNPLRQDTRENQVYRKLKDAILRRRLAPGSQLVENVIANTLDTSRTPVRSALRNLADEGLVTMVPNKGAFVVNPSLKEMQDAFFMRDQLEVLAWEKGGKVCTLDDIKDLKRMVAEETRAVMQKDFDQYLEINRAFHLLPARKWGNVYLISFMEKLLTQIGIYLTLYDAFYDRAPDQVNSLREHACIIELLEQQTWDELLEAVRHHNQSSQDNLQTQQQAFYSLEDALGVIQ
jgi:DNA-binding GntR family transcriptional regulator